MFPLLHQRLAEIMVLLVIDGAGSKEGCVHRSKLEGGSNWSGAARLTSNSVGSRSGGTQGLNK